MSTEKQFIKINNSFISERSRLHLTDKELYLYSVLLFEKSIKRHLKTSVILLHLLCNGLFAARKDRAYNYIKATLKSLNDKGIIIIHNNNNEIIEEYKNDDLIIVKFCGHETVRNKFTMIYEHQFEQFKDDFTSFYIYLVTKQWEKSKEGFIASYSEWGKVLQISSRAAISKVNKTVKDKIIYKSVGDYSEGNMRETENGDYLIQDCNSYKIKPFSYEEMSNISKREERERIRDMQRVNKEFTFGYNDNDLDEVATIFNTFEIEGMPFFPVEEDYMFYMEVLYNNPEGFFTEKEAELVKAAEKRIDLLKGNPNSLSKFDIVYEKAEVEFAKKLYEKENTVTISEEGEIIKNEEVTFPPYDYEDYPDNIF